jgi:hypothetical protein
VSDFYLEHLFEHKIQAQDIPLTITFSASPKKLAEIKHAYNPETFLVSFKVLTPLFMPIVGDRSVHLKEEGPISHLQIRSGCRDRK